MNIKNYGKLINSLTWNTIASVEYDSKMYSQVSALLLYDTLNDVTYWL